MLSHNHIETILHVETQVNADSASREIIIAQEAVGCKEVARRRGGSMSTKKELPAGGYFRSTFIFEGHRYERKSKISQKDADQKAALFEAQLKQGDVGISSNMTVKAWAMEWLDVYKKPSIGDKQYEDYLRHIEKDIVPVVGRKALKDVKPVELQKIVNRHAGQSKSSVDKITKTVKAIFRRAYETDLILRDPSKGIETPSAEAGTHRSITDAERKAILEVAETHRAGLWVKTLLYCGPRPGETRALDWRHVDFDKKLLRIELAMKANSRKIDVPKSAAGFRDVPIPDVLLDDLWKARGGPFDPVFARDTPGLHHTKSSMEKMWDSFIRELDIHMGATLYRNQIQISVVAPDLTAYCLRHTYCTDLQDKGVPINIARYLMGHSDISITAKIYTHTTEKAIQTAADLINKKEQDVAQSVAPTP